MSNVAKKEREGFEDASVKLIVRLSVLKWLKNPRTRISHRRRQLNVAFLYE